VLISNIFAIMGLRARYFLLAVASAKHALFGHGLAVILAFVGTKMVLMDVLKFPGWVSLIVVVGMLSLAAWLSLRSSSISSGASASKVVRQGGARDRVSCPLSSRMRFCR